MIHTILILIMRKLFQLLHLARPTVSLGMNAMKLSATALVLTLATLTGCALEMAQPSDSALEAPISAQEVVVQVPVITITSENFGLDEAHAITFLFALDPEFTSDERLTIEAALSAWNPHMPHVTFGVVTDDSPSIHTIAKGYTPYAGASGGNIGGRIETGITIVLDVNHTPAENLYMAAIHEAGHLAAFRGDHLPEGTVAIMTPITSRSEITRADLEYCGPRCN